jgi:hypothetical protein
MYLLARSSRIEENLIELFNSGEKRLAQLFLTPCKSRQGRQAEADSGNVQSRNGERSERSQGQPSSVMH